MAAQPLAGSLERAARAIADRDLPSVIELISGRPWLVVDQADASLKFRGPRPIEAGSGIDLCPTTHLAMSSIQSVNSSQSSVVNQYQDYIEKLRAIKASADATRDTANGAQQEQQTPQVDADHDGD